MVVLPEVVFGGKAVTNPEPRFCAAAVGWSSHRLIPSKAFPAPHPIYGEVANLPNFAPNSRLHAM